MRWYEPFKYFSLDALNTSLITDTLSLIKDHISFKIRFVADSCSQIFKSSTRLYFRTSYLYPTFSQYILAPFHMQQVSIRDLYWSCFNYQSCGIWLSSVFRAVLLGGKRRKKYYFFLVRFVFFKPEPYANYKTTVISFLFNLLQKCWIPPNQIVRHSVLNIAAVLLGNTTGNTA